MLELLPKVGGGLYAEGDVDAGIHGTHIICLFTQTKYTNILTSVAWTREETKSKQVVTPNLES